LYKLLQLIYICKSPDPYAHGISQAPILCLLCLKHCVTILNIAQLHLLLSSGAQCLVEEHPDHLKQEAADKEEDEQV